MRLRSGQLRLVRVSFKMYSIPWLIKVNTRHDMIDKRIERPVFWKRATHVRVMGRLIARLTQVHVL